jgi:hypothetical protein
MDREHIIRNVPRPGGTSIDAEQPAIDFGNVESASTSCALVDDVSAAPPPKRKSRRVPLILAACAAVVAGVVYVATRSEPSSLDKAWQRARSQAESDATARGPRELTPAECWALSQTPTDRARTLHDARCRP